MHVRTDHSRVARIIVLVLVAALLASSLSPRPVAQAQEVTPASPCPTSIRLEVPADGSPEAYYAFSATVSPSNAGPSLQVVWIVTGKDNFLDTTSVSSHEFSWAAGGPKTIQVRASVLDGACHAISEQRTITISPMPLSAVPLAPYRLAAQLLEEQRAVAPNWADASFYAPSGQGMAGFVTPLYRPDVKDSRGDLIPAYYEFQVFGPTDPNTLRGFIIVSTGAHDHPITNWSTGWDYAALGAPPRRH